MNDSPVTIDDINLELLGLQLTKRVSMESSSTVNRTPSFRTDHTPASVEQHEPPLTTVYASSEPFPIVQAEEKDSGIDITEIESSELTPTAWESETQSLSGRSTIPLLKDGSSLSNETTHVPSVHTAAPSKGRRHISKWSAACAFTVVIATISSTFFGTAALTYLLRARTGNLFDPITLGGNYTLSNAKLLDFFFSAVISPLVLALLNLSIFSLVRSSTLHEHIWNKKSVPLIAVVELSTTNWGSYSPIKFRNLVVSKEVRFILAAVITVFAALSYSCLTNIIGYQATGYHVSRHNKTLDYLFQPVKAVDNCAASNAWFDDDNGVLCATSSYWSPEKNLLPDISGESLSTFRSGLVDAMGRISEGSYGARVRSGKYYGINASIISLTSEWPIQRPTTDIPDVSLYALNYSCSPLNISNFSIQPASFARIAVTAINITGNDQNYTSLLPFSSESLALACVPIVGFNANQTFFGKLCNQNPNATVEIHGFASEEFGNITSLTKSFEMSPTKFQSITTNLTLHGVVCEFFEQHGFGTIYQNRDQENSSLVDSWKVRDAGPLSFPVRSTPVLWQLQLSDLFQKAGPYQRLQGLGSIAASTRTIPVSNDQLWRGDTPALQLQSADLGYNWTNFIESFLYMEGSARFLALNSLQNETLSGEVPNSNYQIWMDMATEQLYTLTYVPWLLLAGMAAMVVTGILTIVIAASSLNSHAFLSSRLLDPLRMVMDVGEVIEPDDFTRSVMWSDTALSDWSRSNHVRYILVRETDPEAEINDKPQGDMYLKLQKVAR
ncbi:hypothetical protein H2198_005704 [Neophaeococcomyces mojaviensis]|uniref:Uncharacterized protein n=1 Tax=Neophaeococcomyces mojaviensis TaxID=3383035 RepID=A0ACC3A4U9_9EURO|nr:hypothetical protein H2198_005704 [Knufia sp. JES_112]